MNMETYGPLRVIELYLQKHLLTDLTLFDLLQTYTPKTNVFKFERFSYAELEMKETPTGLTFFIYHNRLLIYYNQPTKLYYDFRCISDLDHVKQIIKTEKIIITTAPRIVRMFEELNLRRNFKEFKGRLIEFNNRCMYEQNKYYSLDSIL